MGWIAQWIEHKILNRTPARQPIITDKTELAMLDHIDKNEADWPPEYDLLALYNTHISKGFVPSAQLAHTMGVIQHRYDSIYLPSQGIHTPSNAAHARGPR